MHIVDTSPEAASLRASALATSNRLSDLSIKAGALAGLLDFISRSEALSAPHQLALGHLAEEVQQLENAIEAEAVQLSNAVRGE